MLSTVKNELLNLEVNYQFGEWEGDIVYLYFIGEYIESESFTEDNFEDIEFILTGFARGQNAYLQLENIKNKIKKRFFNGVTVLKNNKAVTIFYGNSISGIPTGELELKKIQINLKIKQCEVI